jgi:hypothetical protein
LPKIYHFDITRARNPSKATQAGAVTAAGKLNLASSLLFRGVAAIVEAYLIYWSVVYFISRKFFGFSRDDCACFRAFSAA